METTSALLAMCAENSPVTGEFPAQSQWRWALMFSLICAWMNGSVNNREAGDLRRYRANYDVTLICRKNDMILLIFAVTKKNPYNSLRFQRMTGVSVWHKLDHTKRVNLSVIRHQLIIISFICAICKLFKSIQCSKMQHGYPTIDDDYMHTNGQTKLLLYWTSVSTLVK